MRLQFELEGLFEKGKDGKEFGQAALKQLFLDHHHQELSTLIDTVFKTVYDFYQPEGIEDDGTVLIIRKVGK